METKKALVEIKKTQGRILETQIEILGILEKPRWNFRKPKWNSGSAGRISKIQNVFKCSVMRIYVHEYVHGFYIFTQLDPNRNSKKKLAY